MTEAKKILQMIEGFSITPAMCAFEIGERLREIDQFVAAYVENRELKFNDDYTAYRGTVSWVDSGEEPDGMLWVSLPEYTRSRDALKAIRPEGWSVFTHTTSTGSMATMERLSPQKLVTMRNLPAEELAELHAIIQAIEYERTKK